MNAKVVIGALKSLGKLIVWGGMHPTLCPEDCVGHVDIVCRGEGEEFMIELVERLSSGRGYRDILNGAHLDNGHMVTNEMRPLIADLDRLPIPDFSFTDEYSMGSSGELRQGIALRQSSNVLLSGSRGCLCSCHYCSNARLKTLYAGKGRSVRKMSVSRFIESVDSCRRLFPNVRRFYFTDEDFFARTVDEFREFSEEYPKKVGVPFECMASPQQITVEKTALLVKAGMWRVDVGVESGSDRVKKEIYNRWVPNATVMKAAAMLNEHSQLIAYYFFIIGNPYESKEDLLDTIDFISRLPFPCFLRTYSLVFLPGTQLFEKAQKEGIIRGLEDCGCKFDFLAGIDYRGHPWKANNLYLNGLISLMSGKLKRYRLGFVPRLLLSVLLHPLWIDFNDRHHALSKVMIMAARSGLAARRAIYELMSRALRDPGSVHNLSHFFKAKCTKWRRNI